MTELPFLPLDVPRFLTDPKVASMPGGEAKGVYLLLLLRMWMNGGWISADDRIVSRALDLDIRRWRAAFKPIIAPLLRREIEAHVGDIYTQKRLTEVRRSALETVAKNKARTARATAAKAANARRARSVTSRQPANVTKPATEPVTEIGTTTKVEVEKDRALPIKKAERSIQPKSQDLSASSGEIAAAAPVASPSLKGGSLPPPSPALLRSRIVKGNGNAGPPQEPEPERDRGDQGAVPEPQRTAPADQPAAGLFGLVEAARRRKDDDEH